MMESKPEPFQMGKIRSVSVPPVLRLDGSRDEGLTMAPTDEFRDEIETINVWIGRHDGKIDAYWKAQHEANGKTEAKLEALSKDVASLVISSKLLKVICWLLGILGPLVGFLLAKALPRLFGD